MRDWEKREKQELDAASDVSERYKYPPRRNPVKSLAAFASAKEQ